MLHSAFGYEAVVLVSDLEQHTGPGLCVGTDYEKASTFST